MALLRDKVLTVMAEHGLQRGQRGPEIYVMAEITSNVSPASTATRKPSAITSPERPPRFRRVSRRTWNRRDLPQPRQRDQNDQAPRRAGDRNV